MPAPRPRRHSEAHETLLAEVRGCRLCHDRLPRGARPILQVDARARVLIASQAPGRLAHESGVPFRDPSGERLRDWMAVPPEVFYDASKIAIVPLGLCYPGTGSSGDHPPRPECAPAWRSRLLAALPNLVLTLVIGRHAQQHHLGGPPGTTLTDRMRAWRDHLPERLPLPHPSPRNRAWLRRHPWFEEEVVPYLQARLRALGIHR